MQVLTLKTYFFLLHLLLSGTTYLSFNKRDLKDTSKGKGTCLKKQNIHQNHSQIWQSSQKCQTMNNWPDFKGTSGKSRQHKWIDNISTVMETPMRFEREMLEMKKSWRSGEMTYQLREFSTLLKDLSLVTSIHI